MDRNALDFRSTQSVRDVLPPLSDRSDATAAPHAAFAVPLPSHSNTALDIFANAEKLPAYPLQKLLNHDSQAQQHTLPSSQTSSVSQHSHHHYPYYTNGNRTSNSGGSQDTNSSADTTASTDTDRLFTPALSEAELSTGGGGSGSVDGSTTANGYNFDNDASSQESQLHQLSILAAAQQRMNDARLDATDAGASSRKRAADGSVKHARNASSTSPVFGTGFSNGHGLGHGHSRNASTVSVASTAGGRIGELSAELKTRLSYAMVKVNNGWQSHSLEQVENMSQQVASPSSTASTIKGHGRLGVSVSPRVPATRPHHRRHQSFASQSTAEQNSRSAHSIPPLPSPLAPPHNRLVTQPSAHSSSQPTRSLAPPASIQPSRPSALSRRNSNPAFAPPSLAHSYSQGASPHTPAFDQNSHRVPASGDHMMFSPHQNVREQDAIETLLFMSSPGNSSNMKHFPSIGSSSQPLPSGHHDPYQSLQSPLSTTTTASPQRHALPNGPRKSLPSGRPHAQTFSGSQLHPAANCGRGHNRNVSDMDIDESYASPYARSNKGTPKRRANGADGPTPRIKMPLPMSSGLGVSAKPRPVLDEDDIEKMLDRAAAASADDSSDSESEILIPSRRATQMGV